MLTIYIFRAYNRAVLKQQMADKWTSQRQSLTAKVFSRNFVILKKMGV